MKTNIYTFSETDLEYKKVSFKSLLILPVVFICAILFNYFYFYSPIIEVTDWRGERVKQTIEETINNYLIQKNY